MTRAICMTGKCSADCPQNCLGREGFSQNSMYDILFILVVVVILGYMYMTK